MIAKRIFCAIFALALTIAAIAVLFPDLIPQVSTEQLAALGQTDIYHFPFYGDAGQAEAGTRYGISNILEAYADYVETGTDAAPDFLQLCGFMFSGMDFLSELYAFTILALLTIPVYMLLRLLVFNELYRMAEDSMWLARVFTRGLVAIDASLVTVTATSVLQKRYLNMLLDFLSEKLSALTSMQFALNATNLVILAVIIFAVIALLRATLFRGSVFVSILGAVLRTLLYIVLIAVISVFIGRMTFRTILFMLAALLVIGIIKDVFMPEEKPRRSERRNYRERRRDY